MEFLSTLYFRKVFLGQVFSSQNNYSSGYSNKLKVIQLFSFCGNKHSKKISKSLGLKDIF